MSSSTFLSQFEGVVDKTGALGEHRRAAWQKLLLQGMPSKKDPRFKGVSLRELYGLEWSTSAEFEVSKDLFKSAILPSCEHSHLVFVNGKFSFALSDLSALPQNLIVSSLPKALSTHGVFLKKSFEELLLQEEDPFALLSLALAQEGAFVYLPPKIKVEAPLQVLFVQTANEPQVSAPHLHLVLGAHSSLECAVTSFQVQDQKTYSLPTLQLLLEESASLHLSDQMSSAYLMQTLKVTVKKEARFEGVFVSKGSELSRLSYQACLKEEGARVDLSGLSTLCGANRSHIYGLIEHRAPHTESMQLFKSVSDDHSHFSYSGKIFVEPQAQKTQAYQLSKALVLSPHALVTNEPNLEIGADDVKASHGCTVSQLSDKELFYFQARGIAPKEAKRLLLQGFCLEILNKMSPQLFATHQRGLSV